MTTICNENNHRRFIVVCVVSLIPCPRVMCNVTLILSYLSSSALLVVWKYLGLISKFFGFMMAKEWVLRCCTSNYFIALISCPSMIWLKNSMTWVLLPPVTMYRNKFDLESSKQCLFVVREGSFRRLRAASVSNCC